MRLGIAGMVPNDFRALTAKHLEAIQNLRLTGIGLVGNRETLFDTQCAECRQSQRLIEQAGMDLVQFIVGYGECLFDPDIDVRNQLIDLIGRGIEVSKELDAQVCLIRTGSLSQNGPYSPSRQNLAPECRTRLIDTLGQIAKKAEAAAQTVVIETHVLTIMNSPETNKEILDMVGSPYIKVVMDYVNHFQSLHQVYHSTERIHQIFDIMGPLSVMGHCKDIQVRDGFVVHFDEEIPGEGELDLATALQRWHTLQPDGYMLLEHLPAENYPLASRNTHRIAAEAGVKIY